jgi:hypothetical protein
MIRQPAAKSDTVATRKQRAAYTLIELLIAAVLTASLMTVIWGLLSMYNGWLTAGRVQSEERQLRRSLRVQLQADLEAVSLTDSARETRFLESAAESTLADQETLAEDAVEDPLVTSMEPRLEAEDLPSWLQSLQLPAERPGVPPVSLLGTSTLLRLVLPARPEEVDSLTAQPGVAAVQDPVDDVPAGSQLQLSQNQPAQNQLSPVRIVLWQFRPWGAGMTDVTSAENADTTLEGAAASQLQLQLPPSGLTRQEWDGVTLLQLARQQGVDNTAAPLSMESGATSAATLMESAVPLDQEHIPESVAVEFAYFDGRTWQSSWNSTAQAGLPVAVRLRMWMVSSADAERLMKPAESTGLSAPSAGSSVPAADAVSPAVQTDTVVPLQLVETLLVLQPISGAMPGLTDPEAAAETEAETGLSGGVL